MGLNELKIPESLRPERRNRSNYSRRQRKRAGNDAACIDCGLERATPHFGTQRIEQQITSLGHASRNYESVGIEDVDEVRNADTEEMSGIANDFKRNAITGE